MIKKNLKKRILIAPLNWGIGHASRMIPIIAELIKQGAEVVIAAEGFPLKLLRNRFPALEYIEFPGFEIQYSEKRKHFMGKMFIQLPKILNGVYQEHKTLQNIIKTHSIDAVISDNRFGLFSKQVPCVFVSHQVEIIVPKSIPFLSHIINRINRLIISQYQLLWIPDLKGSFNLSGDLSHSTKIPKSQFLGPLSRFSLASNKKETIGEKFDVLVSLSGPEPQRTLLEKKLINQLLNTNYSAVILQGKPGQKKEANPSDKILLLPHTEDAEFISYIENSNMLISRSGYSTIMDLFVLNKKAVFIPTPGQTEQEYLAERFKKERICNSFTQNEFEIEKAFAEDAMYSGFTYQQENDSYTQIITDFLRKI